MIWLLLSCVAETPPPVAAPPVEPAPARPTREPASIDSSASLAAYLAGPLELGSCRDGRVRSEGVIVVDAADRTHVDWLLGVVDGDDPDAAAIAAGVLWDRRVALPGARAPALARLWIGLHDRTELPRYGCRRLRGGTEEERLWNARGDALGLLSLVADRAAARAAAREVTRSRPELTEPALAALGDEAAAARLAEVAFGQLCSGRTWETTFLLRALDIGKKGASLEPLTRLENHQCP